MARAVVSYVCQQCGAAFPKWAGKCDDCGAWNTLVEERKDTPSGPGKKATGRQITLESLQSAQAAAPLPRMQSDISEFDRVAGGGLVPGSATLIGGDPGIGKSTLLLQLTCNCSKARLSCGLYFWRRVGRSGAHAGQPSGSSQCRG